MTLDHLPYAILFGCAYVLFAWMWFQRTRVFYYFFLDYRRPYAIWAYLGLLLTLTVFYGLSYGLSAAAHQAIDHWWLYPLLATATLGITRFRPPVLAVTRRARFG